MKTKLNLMLALWGLLIFGLIGTPLRAQISEGGTPPSFAYAGSYAVQQKSAAQSILVDFDVNQLRVEDQIKASEGGAYIPRVGMKIPVSYTVENSGEWTTLPNEMKIWRLTISAPEALAIMLYYDEFRIPAGGKLFIYNKSKNHVIGAFTEKSNPGNRKFATELVAGDEVTLEYVAPYAPTFIPAGGTAAEQKVEAPSIKISQIGYAYNNITVDDGFRTQSFNTSLSCQVNINCPEGESWQDQKKGVAKTIVPTPDYKGFGWCSGTIVNNTKQDLTPYFLTAFHCIEGQTQWDFEQTVYYFHYEHPGCENDLLAPTGYKTMVGAEVLVQIPVVDNSDGALLKLLNPIPTDYNVYYNGWDRRDVAAAKGVGIHHPASDVKKISTYTKAATSTFWYGRNSANQLERGADDAHWNIIWAKTASGNGSTEGGSSGSPLFNQDGRVVGTLTGGPPSLCKSTNTSKYGKLWYHWDKHGTQKMKPYLDPLGTNQETLDGTYSNKSATMADFMLSSSSIFAGQSVVFTDRSNGAATWDWTFSNGTPATFSGQTPGAVVFATAGTHNVTLTINKGTATEATATKTVEVTLKGGSAAAIPVANFSIENVSPILVQGFDSSSTPAGWTNTVGPSGTSTNKWIYGNFAGNLNFRTYEAHSTNSAFIQADVTSTKVLDAWLTGPTITLPSANDPIFLEFYTLSSGFMTKNRMLNVNISTDNGATWQTIWTNSNTNTNSLEMLWRKEKVDLTPYAGQTAVLAFQAFGPCTNNFGYFGIDGVKVFKGGNPNFVENIVVGEHITPIDMSTGYPTEWEWTFEGAEVTSSSLQQPGKIRYMNPGTYNITLKVSNGLGTDTRTFTSGVVVSDVVPVANFESSNAYTRKSDFALAVPIKAPVSFVDKSTNYPSSWLWVLNGAEPASSTDQNVTSVVYNAEGLYDVSLTAKNSAGENTLSIPSYANVGYKTHDIWNMKKGESVNNIWKASATNFITGSNDRSNIEYAEYFSAPLAAGVVRKVTIDFFLGTPTTTTSLMLKFYKQGNDGYPSTAFYTQAIPVESISTSGPTTITLPKELSIEGAFFIAVSGFGSTTNQNLAIRASDLRDPSENKVYLFNFSDALSGSQPWHTMHESYGVGLSLNIVPEFTYVYFEGVEFEGVEGKKKVLRKNIDDTEGTVTIKTNAYWSVTADPWINVSKTSATGDGSFTYKVENNIGAPRVGAITVKCLGEERAILVLQAGPNPEELFANIDNDDAGEVSLSWSVPSIKLPYAVGDNIAEDVEGHVDFAINSPGFYSWTYVDGDNSGTYSISGTDFPGEGEKSAFFVMNSDACTPALSTKPHSKQKMFATMVAQGVPNNDWMISPELGYNGQPFTVSLWARSHAAYYEAERLRVVYSKTGSNVADFTYSASPGTYLSVPATWTKYTYTIPGDAKYVAFNCVSNDAFMLFIDDIFIGIPDETSSTGVLANEAISQAAEDSSVTYTKIATTPLFTKEEVEAIKASKPANEESFIFTEISKGTSVKVELNKAATSKVVTEKAQANNGFTAIPLALSEKQTAAAQTAPEEATAAEKPLSTAKLSWNSGIRENSIGLASGGDMEVGIRFAPADIAKYHNAKIIAVDVFLNALPKQGITLKVYKGLNVIYTQNVQAVYKKEFFRITLPTPVTIDASEDLYISYAFTQLPGSDNYVAATDGGPAIPGKGDLIYDSSEGAFYSLYKLSNLNYNWLIRAVVEENSGYKLTYNIYRDGNKIAEATPNEYVDASLLTTNPCYRVTALYNDELESTPTNIACATLKPLLVVTANNASRKVGQANPTFDLAYSGFIDGDDESKLNTKPTASTTATVSSPVGTYPITVGGGSDSKYRFKYVDGTLTVGKQMLTVSVANASRWAGQPNPEFVLSYTGFIGADTPASLATAPKASTTATADSPAGTYPITIAGGQDTKYDFTYTNATLTVNAKQMLTVSVANAKRTEGEANPAFTLTFSGFSGADTEASLAVAPVATTTATIASAPGTYPITISGGSDPKYSFTYEDGTLTVEAKPVVNVTVANATRVYGDANPEFVISYSGFIDGDDESKLDVKPTATTTATASDRSGSYPIIVSGGQDSKYNFSYTNGTLVVNKRPVTISVENVSRKIGEANPSTYTFTYEGLVEGDDPRNVFLMHPSASCTASEMSPIGSYPILLSGGACNKYDITVVNGVLTVTGGLFNKDANAFTPYDADGYNDVFMKGCKITVVNRYGQLIYEGNDGWNGKKKNSSSLVAPGVYYFSATLPDGSSKKGSVTVLKK